MKRKRTLFIHECKQVWWLMLMATLMVLFISLVLFTDDTGFIMNEKGSVINYQVTYMFDNLFIPVFIGIVILGVVQFASVRKKGSGDFMNALPYYRKETFIAKIIAGLMVITIPMLILFVFSSVFHALYFEASMKNVAYLSDFEMFYHNERFGMLAMQFVLFYLFAVSFYLLNVMMQMLICHRFFAAAVVVLGAGTPYAVSAMWMDSIALLDEKIPETLVKCKDLFSVFYRGSLFSVDYIYPDDVYDNSNAYVMVECEMLWEKIFFLFALGVLFLLVGYFVRIKQDDAKTSVTLPYKVVRIGLYSCIMIAVASIAFNIVCDSFGYNLGRPLVIATIGTLIIGVLLWWLLIKRKGGMAS